VEAEKPERTYDSWKEELDSCEVLWDWQIEGMVSDGARALIKLASEKLVCVHVPDLFHVLRALAQPLGQSLGRQLSSVDQELKKLQQRLDKTRNPAQQQTFEASKNHSEQRLSTRQHWQQTYHQALWAITKALHPFDDSTGEWQLWQALEDRLMTPLRELEQLCDQLNLAKGLEAVEKFRASNTHSCWRLAHLVARGYPGAQPAWR